MTTGKTWLVDLAQAKQQGSVPRLTKISLIERISIEHGHSLGLWDPNKEYTRSPTYPPDTSLEAAGIEFFATIRDLPVKSRLS